MFYSINTLLNRLILNINNVKTNFLLLYMYLIPLIRSSRTIAASLIFPENPLPAIAISEVISVIGPILKPDLFPRILGTIMAIMYQPYFANYYIKK